MLVLHRFAGESIVITVPPSAAETVVRVLVLEIGKTRSKLGIEALKHVEIHREEIWQRIHDGSQATNSGPVGS